MSSIKSKIDPNNTDSLSPLSFMLLTATLELPVYNAFGNL